MEPADAGPEAPDYDQCHLIRVSYDELPGAVRAEVDAALDSGEYRAETLLFDDAVDVSYSYVEVGETPYEPRVETDGETKILTLTEVDAMRTPEPRTIVAENDTDREQEVRIELVGERKTIIDRTVSLAPSRSRTLEATDEFGSYELTAEALTGHGKEDQFDFQVDDFRQNGDITVTPREIHVSQEVVDYAPCTWER